MGLNHVHFFIQGVYCKKVKVSGIEIDQVVSRCHTQRWFRGIHRELAMKHLGRGWGAQPNKSPKIFSTRMYWRRMHTAYFSGHLLEGGCVCLGVCLPGGGVCPRECLPSVPTPLSTEWLTDRCNNNTQVSFETFGHRNQTTDIVNSAYRNLTSINVPFRT